MKILSLQILKGLSLSLLSPFHLSAYSCISLHDSDWCSFIVKIKSHFQNYRCFFDKKKKNPTEFTQEFQ